MATRMMTKSKPTTTPATHPATDPSVGPNITGNNPGSIEIETGTTVLSESGCLLLASTFNLIIPSILSRLDEYSNAEESNALLRMIAPLVESIVKWGIPTLETMLYEMKPSGPSS